MPEYADCYKPDADGIMPINRMREAAQAQQATNRAQARLALEAILGKVVLIADVSQIGRPVAGEHRSLFVEYTSNGQLVRKPVLLRPGITMDELVVQLSG